MLRTQLMKLPKTSISLEIKHEVSRHHKTLGFRKGLCCSARKGYCNQQRCNRELRCNNCGGELRLYLGEPCDKQPMCANCKGPFTAGYKGYAATVKRVNGRLIKPSGTERKKIRKAEARRYKTVLIQSPRGAAQIVDR